MTYEGIHSLHGTPRRVQHHTLWRCSKHVPAPALRQMGRRSETITWILLELITESPSCLVLLKVPQFWTRAELQLAGQN